MHWTDGLKSLSNESTARRAYMILHPWVWVAMLQDQDVVDAFAITKEKSDIPGLGTLVGHIHGIPVFVRT